MTGAAAAGAAASLGSSLDFSRCLPRELAHRRALAEVFVTDSAQLGEDEYAVAIQIPRAHSLWFDRRVPYHDPLAALEASRQATFVIVHRHLGVERGPPFTLRRIEFRVLDLEAFRDDGEPLEAIWHARLEAVEAREEILVGMGLRGTLLVDGAVAATLSGEVAMLPRREYELVRATQRARVTAERRARPPLGRRVDPTAVGRGDRRNVVLGAAEDRGEAGGRARRLVVDEAHPSFYDHPQDHVPGPLLVEAFRQAALLAAVEAETLARADAVVVGCEASFGDFCEPDAAAWCSAEVLPEPGPGAAVEVALHQFGSRFATARIELEAPA